MTYEIIITLAVLAAVLVGLISNKIPADVVLVGGMVAALGLGLITPAQALAGFSNAGVMTVAVLYVIAAALQDTGAIYWLSHHILGRPKTQRGSLLRLATPVGLFSAFLNNTAVVAMLIPAVQDWAKRLKLPVSKLLMPLSFAAILGGTCTLIGTSTNLVVNGLMQDYGLPQLGIFEIAWVGVPLLIVGVITLFLLAPVLLPARQGLVQQVESARQYQVQMQVLDKSSLPGKTIQQAGLRNLSYGYLTEILRGGQLLTAVGSQNRLQKGDVLTFIGAPECARELQHINGLKPIYGEGAGLNLANHQRRLVEVVIGASFPGLNKTVKDYGFRTRYQAAILGISRNGQRLVGKIGGMRLHMGDTLLLEASESFVEQYQHRRDFLLVSLLQDSHPPNFTKAPLAVGILLAMVATAALGWLDILQAAFFAGGALLLTGCLSITRARQSVSNNLSVLVVIAASFALGAAVQESGTAQWLTTALFGGLTAHPYWALAGLFIVTLLFTSLITNNAAAVLMFPIATQLAEQFQASPTPFIIAIMFAASASFLTPIGYQTNLMVMGPGGYRFTDYLRLGLPLTLVTTVVCVLLIPMVWPF